MDVKYDNSRDRFIIPYFGDMSDIENIKAFEDRELTADVLRKAEVKLEKARLNVRKLEAELSGIENLYEVSQEITHVRNGIPVSEYYHPITEESLYFGKYVLSTVGKTWDRRLVKTWVNANLSDDVKLNSKYVHCFSINEGGDSRDVTFLANRYTEFKSDDGFSIEFIKFIANEFVVNGLPASSFDGGNLYEWIDIFNRDSVIDSILNSKK